jgi:hypothetical protein
VIFSIIAFAITLANLLWFRTLDGVVSNSFLHLAIFNQLVASGFALLGFLRFGGQKMRPNYQIGRPPIWTLSRAFTILTLVAALGAILIPAAELIGW